MSAPDTAAAGGWAFDPADLMRRPEPVTRRRLGRLPFLPADSVGLRLVLLAAAVLGAYHYSLLTLVRNLGLDTPLAYLGLVPAMAVGIALLQPRRAEPGRDIHDRQVDLIVGLPLVAAALIIEMVLPGKLNSEFWVYRIDLLTMPVFVAGAVVLLFGVRTLWRFRVAVAFLFLAWPVPYAWLIEHFLDRTTATTIHGITAVIRHWHVATQVPGGDGSTFTIVHGASSYQVQVASACSGVNSLVGFALVGSAFGALVTGGRVRKAVWLVLGLGLVWSLNVLRIVLIFAAGKAWGERVADDGLHPFLGLVVFAVAVLIMVATMPLFRLRIGGPREKETAPARVRTRALLAARPRAALGMRVAGASLAIGAVALTAANGGFSRFQLTAGDFGSPKVVGLQAAQSTVPGYASTQVSEYPWVKRFFGGSSSWKRYSYAPTYGGYGASYGGFGAGSGTIYADVIDSSKIAPFNAYGIEACYSFHGYTVTGEHSVDLGGVEGHVLQYRDAPHDRAWNVVYWIWVVQDAHGQKRYERVTLLQPAGAVDGNAAQPTSSPLKGVGYDAPGRAETTAPTLTARQITALRQAGENQLVAFAKEAVAGAHPIVGADTTATTTTANGTAGS